MEKLREGVRELEADGYVDPGELSSLIDRLQAVLCRALNEGRKRGDHLVTGQSPCAWAASLCRLSPQSATDRLRVGAQMQNLPRIAEALSSGEIGYQSAALLCHLSDQLGEKRDQIDEELWVDYSKRFSIKSLRYLTEHARYVWDAESVERDDEEDYEQRYLHLSEFGRMYKLDAVLDRAGGAALRSALDALAKPLGSDDVRTPKQRRADAMVELVHHAMDNGTLPRRNGVRPHISVNTTIEGLKGELGAAASELQTGLPVSRKTVQRWACDGALHRALKADSVVVDVGRVSRAVSPAQWRALKARYKSCCWHGCDRPVSWTNPHHIDFWSEGGPSNLPNLLPLCFHHHRLVHEGGWQVVRTSGGFRFIPPDRPAMTKRRWGESLWAA